MQLTGGWDLDDEMPRAHMWGNLAGYKVPRQIVAVPEVTRGPSGKIDISRIRALLAQSATPPDRSPGAIMILGSSWQRVP